MAELRTLGCIELGDLDALGAEALLAQPKRIALLTYLLLGGSVGACRRQHLADLFWPEAGRDRARATLRSALHFLRRHLGSGAIVSRGDGVRVDPREVRCDASAFDALIEAERFAEALSLYRGDLLPGLDLPDSPAFVRWLDTERERLRVAASRAAWALSADEERKGNWISASDLARRATALAGDQEYAVRRLMRLLDRAGDRVAALREYDSFRIRWTRETELSLSPRTIELAEAIRAGSGAIGQIEERNMPIDGRGFSARRSHKLAVFPFDLDGLDLDGRAGYERIAVALAHEVIDSLSRVSEITVVARPVDRHGVREGRTLRQIADELHADWVLDASLRVVADQVLIVVRLVDARTETPLWAQVYEASLGDALTIRIRVVLDILDALRMEPTADQTESLARFPTTESGAYALYLEGRSQSNRRSKRNAESAAQLFERALEIDPSFARAWVGLADSYMFLHPAAGVRLSEARVRAREATRTALRLDARLGDAHATLGILRTILDQDWSEGEKEFRLAVELSPGLPAAHHWLGAFLAYIRQRYEPACRELALARQLDPRSPIIHADLGMALFHSGRRPEGLLEMREALALEPDFWPGHYDLGIASFLCGDPAGGVSHLQRAWAVGAWGAKQRREAVQQTADPSWRSVLAQKLEELRASPGRRAGRGFEAAVVSMLIGRRDDALAWLQTAAKEGSWAFVMQYYPVFGALHHEPTFVRLLEDVGLGHVPDA